MITGPSCIMEEPGLCLKPIFQILILHHTANLTTQGKFRKITKNSGSTERKETSDFLLIIHQYCILLKMNHRKKDTAIPPDNFKNGSRGTAFE